MSTIAYSSIRDNCSMPNNIFLLVFHTDFDSMIYTHIRCRLEDGCSYVYGCGVGRFRRRGWGVEGDWGRSPHAPSQRAAALCTPAFCQRHGLFAPHFGVGRFRRRGWGVEGGRGHSPHAPSQKAAALCTPAFCQRHGLFAPHFGVTRGKPLDRGPGGCAPDFPYPKMSLRSRHRKDKKALAPLPLLFVGTRPKLQLDSSAIKAKRLA